MQTNFSDYQMSLSERNKKLIETVKKYQDNTCFGGIYNACIGLETEELSTQLSTLILPLLSMCNPLIDDIMKNKEVDLHIVDKVRILVHNPGRGFRASEEQDNYFSRSFSLRKIRKAIELVESFPEYSLVRAYVYCRFYYFMQWEGNEQKEYKHKLMEKGYSMVMKKFPFLFAMEKKTILRIKDLSHSDTLMLTQVIQVQVLRLGHLTERKEDLEKLLFRCVRLYEKLLKDEKFKTESLNSTVIFEALSSVYLHVGYFYKGEEEYERSLYYLDKHMSFKRNRNFIRNEFDFSKFNNPTQQGLISKMETVGGISKGFVEVELLDTQILRLHCLIALKRFKESWDLIVFVESRRDQFDDYMVINFKKAIFTYYEETGNFSKAFEAINSSVEEHIKIYGWINDFTVGVVMKRVEYLVRLRRFPQALKDLQRIQKHNPQMRGKSRITSYLKVVEEGIEKEVKVKFDDEKEFNEQKESFEKKKYLNNRKCSNSHCSRTETEKRRFKVCSRCKATVYCSKKCQLQHWSFHKSKCQFVKSSCVNKKVRKCSKCSRTETVEGRKFRLCEGCISVFYCSTKCQKRDWKEHKKSCKKNTQ